MSKEIIGLIAVALVFIAYVPYIRDIIRRKVKPHPVSWLALVVTSSSIFFLQTSSGSGSGAYATATVTVFALCVFLLSLKYSKIKLQLFDVLCLIASLIGVAVWLFIDRPVLSIIVLLTAELIGFAPTIVKGWKKPYDDSITLWGTNAIRHMTGFFAIQNYTFITMLNPIVWITVSLSFSTMLLIKRRHTIKWPWRKRRFEPYN
ncbi:MAG TPA: hypothetical protein PLY16_03025 [Candidatus Saccharibacteria bacterium]|nr:hypothetical protein [Candidatus Saccharibacteria bacterium]